MAQCQTFINADLIAAGLSPLNPEREQLAASRLYLAEIDRCERACQNFAFETTLSGRGYLRLVDRLMQSGWRVEMSYLALSNVQLSHDRVAERVAHGGHGIPTEAIERRFARSLYNLFELYAPRVSLTRCYLNSQDNPDLVFTQQGNHVEILDDAVYRHLRNEAGL
ncbi:Zeta toxin family protein [Castellaniella sp.]|uniref:Zeta toxin family protein n=1 Tax=Castellaniella sp. TaxID=1955812 RepID=UPI002B0006BD|nr:Zeta toxin family protein [Castellaniella sp.]